MYSRKQQYGNQSSLIIKGKNIDLKVLTFAQKDF